MMSRQSLRSWLGTKSRGQEVPRRQGQRNGACSYFKGQGACLGLVKMQILHLLVWVGPEHLHFQEVARPSLLANLTLSSKCRGSSEATSGPAGAPGG